MHLFSLFKEKIKIHSKKYHLIDQIDKTGLNKLYLKELKALLKKEKKINKALKDEVKQLSKAIELNLVKEQLNNLNTTTQKQLDGLSRIRLKLFKKVNYQKFKDACVEEIEQCKFFSKILKEVSTNFKGLERSKDAFEKDKMLVNQAQEKYKELAVSVGNVDKVIKKSKELLLINKKIKKTPLYEFIKYDIDRVTQKAKYALKNPKESRLKFMLAGAYIISPGTFELTGVYLFFRYVRKYIKSKRVNRQGAGASSSDHRSVNY